MLAALAARRTLLIVSVAGGLQAMVIYGTGAWLPSYYMRLGGKSLAEIGGLLALINGGVAWLGIMCGGVVAGALARYSLRWLILIPIIGALVATPLYLGAFRLADPQMSLLVLTPATFFGSLFVAPSLAAVHGVAGVAHRATGVALMLFMSNLLGIGGGALLVGMISDAFASAGPTASLQVGLQLLLIANLVAILGYVAALFTVRSDWRD